MLPFYNPVSLYEPSASARRIWNTLHTILHSRLPVTESRWLYTQSRRLTTVNLHSPPPCQISWTPPTATQSQIRRDSRNRL